jgi:hypothetical protein
LNAGSADFIGSLRLPPDRMSAIDRKVRGP